MFLHVCVCISVHVHKCETMHAWGPFVLGNISICAKKAFENDQILNALWCKMKQCFPVILTSLCSVLLSNEDIKKRFACVISVFHTTRLTSPHHSLPVLLIMPLFVPIEYLLAYLFLITDSRLSVPSNSSPPNTHTQIIHTYTHTHW